MLLKPLLWILVAAPLATGCSKSWPEPKQAMADAQSASRSAREVGAEDQPAAKLNVTLADERIAEAKALIAEDDNERARYVVVRARADAELALALAHEQNALVAKQKARSNHRPRSNVQGATPRRPSPPRGLIVALFAAAGCASAVPPKDSASARTRITGPRRAPPPPSTRPIFTRRRIHSMTRSGRSRPRGTRRRPAISATPPNAAPRWQSQKRARWRS